MCGIFGVGFLKGNALKDQQKAIRLIESMGRNTEGFGAQCSGISLATPNKITFGKNHEGMNSFLNRQIVIDMLKTNLILNSSMEDTNTYAVVGHCRMPTQGRKEDNNNNHPIRIGHIVGVHAGHVHSDGQLFAENVKNFQRVGGVDSEIIFQLLNYYRGNSSTTNMVDVIKKTAPLLEGSFTCAVLSSIDKYKLYLFRSGPSLEVVFYNKIGLVTFATNHNSIVAPVMKELFTKDEQENTGITLERDTGIVINFRKNTYSKFDLPKKTANSYKRSIY